jgi:hypothetical protein
MVRLLTAYLKSKILLIFLRKSYSIRIDMEMTPKSQIPLAKSVALKVKDARVKLAAQCESGFANNSTIA